jgi:hypothetical protein
MTPDWREAAEAAEKFFALVGDTVDQRIARIATNARALLQSREAGRCRSTALSRWAVRQLDLCSRTFSRPAPPELVQLVEHLLGVSGPERDGQRKNRDKFLAAVEHVARHHDATPSKIGRAINYDRNAVIKTWLEAPEFQEIVAHKRYAIDHAEKKSSNR